jgi:hypothetical protein
MSAVLEDFVLLRMRRGAHTGRIPNEDVRKRVKRHSGARKEGWKERHRGLWKEKGAERGTYQITLIGLAGVQKFQGRERHGWAARGQRWWWESGDVVSLKSGNEEMLCASKSRDPSASRALNSGKVYGNSGLVLVFLLLVLSEDVDGKLATCGSPSTSSSMQGPI